MYVVFGWESGMRRIPDGAEWHLFSGCVPASWGEEYLCKTNMVDWGRGKKWKSHNLVRRFCF
jgi:hypothetical protein